MKILDTSNLRGDVFGGVTAGVVALPLAFVKRMRWSWISRASRLSTFRQHGQWKRSRATPGL
jgi:hypothetical protein